MMVQRSIRELKAEDFDRVFSIANKAYPPYGDKVIKREAYIRNALATRSSGTFYGCFEEDGTLAGFMELYDMKVNIRQRIIDIGGIGFIAVDALKKREGVAQDIMNFYIGHYKQKNVAMAILYPYSIEFYRKKGFVCAARMHQYRIKPSCIPNNGSKLNVVFAGEKDKVELTECFRRYFEKTNGMVMKRDKDIESLIQSNTIAAYVKDGVMDGYIAFNFKKVNPEYNYMDDMIVSEWIWSSREAFAGLAAFLNTQSDQVTRVVLNTPEENLFLVLSDPSNGLNDAFKNTTHEMYVTASDSMYKIIDIKRLFILFEGYKFGDANITVKFHIDDNFARENSGELTVRFEGGKAVIIEGAVADVTVSMTIDAFTAMFCGTADFAELFRLNCADISDETYVDTVSRAFHYPDRPKTITYF